jgi:hypothetical protein
MTIVFALTALAAEPNFGPIVIGQPRPAEPKTVCVPASDLDWRCKAVPLTVAEVPGNVAMELCRENVQRVIFATLILPGGHAVPGSIVSTDIMADTKGAFDKLRGLFVKQGFALPSGDKMGANQVEVTADGFKVSVEMSPVPLTPELPGGSWQAGVVFERVEPCK